MDISLRLSWARNRMRARVVSPLWRGIRSKNRQRILDSDWDQLIVLDACHADLFRTYWSRSETPDIVFSAGSATGEWTRQNFTGRYARGTHYLSANPMFDHSLDQMNHDPFGRREKLWDNPEFWSSELHTVPPSATLGRLVSVAKETDRRVVAHLLQPHYPFVVGSDETAGIAGDHMEWVRSEDGNPQTNPWKMVRDGAVDGDTVWEAYERSTEYVLSLVEERIKTLPGRTVVTADHANSLRGWSLTGLGRVYGHPMNVHTRELVAVPWVAVGNSETERDESDDDVVRERLEAIGYIDA